MMQLIILGHIPGTSVRITFYEYLLLLMAAIGVYIMVAYVRTIRIFEIPQPHTEYAPEIVSPSRQNFDDICI